MQHTLVKCLAAGVVASTPPAAAPVKAESNWDGFCLGVQGGYQLGNADLSKALDASFPDDPGGLNPTQRAAEDLNLTGLSAVPMPVTKLSKAGSCLVLKPTLS